MTACTCYLLSSSTMRPWGHETETMRPWDHEAMRLWDHEIMRPWDYETMRPWGHECSLISTADFSTHKKTHLLQTWIWRWCTSSSATFLLRFAGPRGGRFTDVEVDVGADSDLNRGQGSSENFLSCFLFFTPLHFWWFLRSELLTCIWSACRIPIEIPIALLFSYFSLRWKLWVRFHAYISTLVFLK